MIAIKNCRHDSIALVRDLFVRSRLFSSFSFSSSRMSATIRFLDFFVFIVTRRWTLIMTLLLILFYFRFPSRKSFTSLSLSVSESNVNILRSLTTSRSEMRCSKDGERRLNLTADIINDSFESSLSSCNDGGWDRMTIPLKSRWRRNLFISHSLSELNFSLIFLLSATLFPSGDRLEEVKGLESSFMAIASAIVARRRSF